MSHERERIVSIDPDALDIEWLSQASKVLKYADREAEARDELARAKAKLELVSAELLLEIRSHPTAFRLPPKVTVDLCKAAVTTQKRFQRQQANVFDAKRVADLYSNVVSALEHRKSALGKLCDLHLTGYYSEPKTSNKVTQEQVDSARQRNVRRGLRK